MDGRNKIKANEKKEMRDIHMKTRKRRNNTKEWNDRYKETRCEGKERGAGRLRGERRYISMHMQEPKNQRNSPATKNIGKSGDKRCKEVDYSSHHKSECFKKRSSLNLKELTLGAETQSSGSLFHHSTTRCEKKERRQERREK